MAAGVGMLLGAAAGWSANDDTSSNKSSRSSRASTAKEGGGGANIEAKLDEILSTQQTILQQFDAVMEELRIIKVRSTLRGGS